MNIHVRMPEHLDPEDVAVALANGLIEFGVLIHAEVGQGQMVNGIPLNTILVEEVK